MMVAGIGCKKGVGEREVMEALASALSAHGLGLTALDAIATAAAKRAEPAIGEAARRLGLPLHIIQDDALQAASDGCLTASGHSLAISGLPSLSEAAALASIGAGARLLGPRTVHGNVTCALATLDGVFPSPLVGENGSARSDKTDEGSFAAQITPHPTSPSPGSRSATFSHKGRRYGDKSEPRP
ncbi:MULTISPECIES: cobalamin biosynthesis protein [unclassified Mesorhizobium]|uniref:cobalamin biosynthesis protein n=1 Tax=unclassified Mesorhizobium TaxID=325217 RepID=UPI0009EAD683|nr:cobalamin biosynthesis protein [Mesorhizobium sp. Root1471]